MLHVTITDDKTGACLLDVTTMAIVGAVHRTGLYCHPFSFSDCNRFVIGQTAEAAQNEADRLVASDPHIAFAYKAAARSHGREEGEE